MSSDDEYSKLMEAQQKHFEAQFGSLESIGFEPVVKGSESSEISGSSDDDSSDDEEFKGFSDKSSDDSDGEESDSEDSDSESDNSSNEGPVVVKFSESTPSTVHPKKRNKSLEKGKIASLNSQEIKEKLNQIEIEAELLKNGGADAENLQNDIELQRFISESHILSSQGSSFSGVDITLKTINDDPIGKTKARAMGQRLRNISGTKKLEKMPMNMRKGILKKEIERVEKFEKEAKESGTILAKTGKYELRDLNHNRANKVGFKSDLVGNYKIGKKQLNQKYAHRQKGLQIQTLGKSTRNGLRVSKNEVSKMIGNNNRKGGKHKK